MHRRALRGRPLPAGAWDPTDRERVAITQPTARIIRRHVGDLDAVDADAFDFALIAAGMLHMGARSVLPTPPERPAAAPLPPEVPPDAG